MAVQRFAEEKAREQGGDERRGAEHQQHIGDRGEAQRQDEGDEAAGQQQRTQQKGEARIANVDPHPAALPEKQWQHRGNEQGRAPKRHIPGRQVDAAHNDTCRAENGRRADGVGGAQQGGTL